MLYNSSASTSLTDGAVHAVQQQTCSRGTHAPPVRGGPILVPHRGLKHGLLRQGLRASRVRGVQPGRGLVCRVAELMRGVALVMHSGLVACQHSLVLVAFVVILQQG